MSEVLLRVSSHHTIALLNFLMNIGPLDLFLSNRSHRTDFLLFLLSVVVALNDCRKFDAKSCFFSLDDLGAVTGVVDDQLVDSIDYVLEVFELEVDFLLLSEHGPHDLARPLDCPSFICNFLVGTSVHAQLHVILLLIDLASL